MLKAADLVLGKTYSKEMPKILLSDSTSKTPINELSKDIKYQVFKKFTCLTFFLFKVMKQLILPNCQSCYPTFVSRKENMLFWRSLETTCRAKDVFKIVSTFIATMVFFVENLSVCALMVV